MRFIIHAKSPTGAGNNILQDLNFIKNLEDSMNKANQKQSNSTIVVLLPRIRPDLTRYKSNTRESL